MELQSVISGELAKIIEAGTVQEIIKKQLTKTLEDIISDSMRSYSDFGKEVKAAVQSALRIDLEGVKVLDLSTVISQTIKESLEASVDKTLLASVQESVKEITGEMEKKEWKISEIIQKMKEDSDEFDRDGSSQITFIVQDGSTRYSKYTHYYFDRKSGQEKYNCEFQLDTNDGKVYNFKGGRINKTGDFRFQPIFGSFEKFLFRLYASKCTIIDDSDDVNEYYEDYDD